MSSMQDLWNTSYLSGNNMAYIGGLYEDYLTNPESISKDWQQFFDAMKSKTNHDVSYRDIEDYFRNLTNHKKISTTAVSVAPNAVR